MFALSVADKNAGVIVGLTAYVNKCHIVRAALEAAAFQTYELVKVRHGVVWHPC
jgi:glycerol kinase